MRASKNRSFQGLEDEGQRSAFRRAILAWFDAHRRELPWRNCGDPYGVWVSEVMLQQTRVSTVVEYFERWMERFPAVERLAEAPLEEVLEMWSGLGYYRRARHLHRAAAQVVDEYGGRLPRDISELRQLPGIGPYTAGAIASIAFGKPEALVDGNVTRLLSRLYAVTGDPKRSPAKGQIWKRASQLVDPDRPGDFNQAMMEMGSQVCTSDNPDCGECPLTVWCRAYGLEEPERFPESGKRPEQRPMRARCCVVVRDSAGTSEFLLRRRPDDGLLGGLWEFPSCEKRGTRFPRIADLATRVDDGLPMEVEAGDIGRTVGTVEHVFSHRRLQLRVHDLEVEVEEGVGDDGWRWVARGELSEVASAALLDKVAALWSELDR